MRHNTSKHIYHMLILTSFPLNCGTYIAQIFKASGILCIDSVSSIYTDIHNNR